MIYYVCQKNSACDIQVVELSDNLVSRTNTRRVGITLHRIVKEFYWIQSRNNIDVRSLP